MFLRRLNKNSSSKSRSKLPKKRARKGDRADPNIARRNVLDEDEDRERGDRQNDVDRDEFEVRRPLDSEEEEEDMSASGVPAAVISAAPLGGPRVTIVGCPEEMGFNPSPLTCALVIGSNETNWSIWTGDKRGNVLVIEGEARISTLKSSPPSAVLSIAASAPAIGTGTPHVVTGHKNGKIFVWSPVTKMLLSALSIDLGGHHMPVYGLSFRPLTNTLYSVSQDRSVKIWGVQEGMLIDTFFGPTSTIRCVAGIVSDPTKEACLVGGDDGVPRYFKTDVAKHNVYSGQPDFIEACCYLPSLGGGGDSSSFFVVGTSNGTLALYSAVKSTVLVKVEYAHSYGFVGDGTGFEQWMAKENEGKEAAPPNAFNGNSIGALCALGPSLIASGSCDGQIRFWYVHGSSRILREVSALSSSCHVDGMVTGLHHTMVAPAQSSPYLLLVASVATEPRGGRWLTWTTAKNRVVSWKLLVE